jgi:arginine-tRNA-protein transferase
MSYKTRYRPIEVLGPQGWSLLEDDEALPHRLPAMAGELA